MKFLLDVHIGLHIVRALESAGHDVLRAALAFPTASDDEHLRFAKSENRVLISEDSDFTELIFAHGFEPPPALIYIRCEPFEQDVIAQSLIEVLEDTRLLGHVAVVTAKQVRFRAFPKESDLIAPWLKFPDLPEGSIHWRMGAGEEYRWRFTAWFKALTPEGQAGYLDKFPPPDQWWANIFENLKEN